MIVTQRDKKNHQNPWLPLEVHLVTCPCLADRCGGHTDAGVGQNDSGRCRRRGNRREIADRWSQVTRPSYAVSAVKAISVTPLHLAPSTGDHGTEWGSVIHVLLENAMRSPAANLQRLAEATLANQDFGSSTTAEAVATAQAVMQSPIWQQHSPAHESLPRCRSAPFNHTGRCRIPARSQ